MTIKNWFKKFCAQRPYRAGRKLGLQLEPLEDRAVPALIMVNSLADSPLSSSGGAVTLREAIFAANNDVWVYPGGVSGDGHDTIAFDPSLAGETITLMGGELLITESLTIQGLGADSLTLSGGNNSRLLNLAGDGANVYNINDITLADGNSGDIRSGGAAILMTAGNETLNLNRTVLRNNQTNNKPGSAITSVLATLNVTDSTILNNGSGQGTIYLQDSTASFTNSTLSGNTSEFGSISARSVYGTTNLSLTNTTFANHQGHGGGVFYSAEFAGAVTNIEYRNSIFANNGSSFAVGTTNGTITISSLGNNILDDVAGDTTNSSDQFNTNPLIGSLTEKNGTFIHPLLPGSPAIDAANNVPAPTQDQTGQARNDGDGDGIADADIGAAEFVNSTPILADQAFHVDENTTAVGTIIVADDDLPFDSFTFDLLPNGDDFGHFSIDSNGELTFRSAPDYESSSDFDGNNVYEVAVRVRDLRGATATATVTVTVDPVNDNAPVFVSLPSTQAVEGQPYSYTGSIIFLPWNPAGERVTDPLPLTVNTTNEFNFVYSDSNSFKREKNSGTQNFVINEEYYAGIQTDPGEGGVRITTDPFIDLVIPFNSGPWVTDADAGDTVTYSLDSNNSPDGMTIDPTTGVISWTPTWTQVGDNGVTIIATDSAGNTASQTFTVTVVNLNPWLPSDTDAAANTVPEDASNGTPVGITASSTDPGGATVTYRLTNDAGGAFTIDQDTGVISVLDNALLDGADTVSIAVEASDGIGGTSTTEFDIVVTNVAPQVTSVSTDASSTSPVTTGETVTLSGLFTDVPFDTHIVTIDWGDGNSTTLGTVDQTADSFAATYQYDTGGVYTITVTVTDDDGASTQATTSAFVGGVGLVGDRLYLIGTDGADRITVSERRGQIYVRGSLDGGRSFRFTYDTASVSSVEVDLRGGNDRFTGESKMTLPVIVDGGAGDDTLRTGLGDDLLRGGEGNDSLSSWGGNNVLVGGIGNDSLRVLGGHNILIGGGGQDMIVGGLGDDLFIAGSTSYDTSNTDWNALRAVWSSAATYENRIAQLRAGQTTSGALLEAGVTVLDDDSSDYLSDIYGQAWYFADTIEDNILYLSSDEIVDEL